MHFLYYTNNLLNNRLFKLGNLFDNIFLARLDVGLIRASIELNLAIHLSDSVLLVIGRFTF